MVEDKQLDTGILQALDFPMYHQWHAAMGAEVTDPKNIFERNVIGIT